RFVNLQGAICRKQSNCPTFLRRAILNLNKSQNHFLPLARKLPMDDPSKKFEFKLVLQDEAKYRMIRRMIDADHDTRFPERRFEKAGLVPISFLAALSLAQSQGISLPRRL